MLFILAACASPQPPESLPEFPSWSGTQIGEEGDEPACTMVGEDWTDEGTAPPGSDWTPAELRALGGDHSGSFQSAWQGEEALAATVTLDGDAQALSDTMALCASALGIDGTLVLATDTLLSLQIPITVIARLDSDVGFQAYADASVLNGELSPGLLPDDALALWVVVQGALTDSGWAGELVWELERESRGEASTAGTWSVQPLTGAGKQ